MIRGLGDSVRRAAAAAAAADASAGTRAFRAIALTPSTGSAASGTFAAAPPPAVHTARRHMGKATRPDNVPLAELPLIANMIIERLPAVTPRLAKWEADYQEW